MTKVYIYAALCLLVLGNPSFAQQKFSDPFGIEGLFPVKKLSQEEFEQRTYFKALAGKPTLESEKCSFRTYYSKSDGYVFEILNQNKPYITLNTQKGLAELKTDFQNNETEKTHILKQEIGKNSVLESYRRRVHKELRVSTNKNNVIEWIEMKEWVTYSSLIKPDHTPEPKLLKCIFVPKETKKSESPESTKPEIQNEHLDGSSN